MRPKLLFATIVLLAFQFSFSQPYIPMLNNSSWNLVSSNFFGNENLLMSGGVDVVIGAYTYKKYTDPTIYTSDNFVREDVANRKVYRNVNGVDQLLYDFSLQVGNHIVLSDGKNYVVQSITNVNVVGSQRRMFNLVYYVGTFAVNSEVWIEGVGSNRHPLKPAFEMIFSDPYIYTTCSAQNGVAVYNHGIANGQPTPTDCSMLGNDEQNYATQQINFYPNPFTTELTITASQDFENATLKIFNSIGQLVRETSNLNGKNVSLNKENLQPGIYFIQLLHEGKTTTTKKIIITD